MVDDEFEKLFTRIPATPRRRRRGRPEAVLQKQIVAWLIGHGVLVAVTDAGMLSKMGLGMSCGIPKGWPDITGCTQDGRFVGVEVKSPTGRQSPDQRVVQEQIEARNGLYILAYCLADVEQALYHKAGG
jgi:hypothetical protein